MLILTVRGSARQFAKKEAAATKLLNLCDKAGGVCRFAAMTRGDVGKFARADRAAAGLRTGTGGSRPAGGLLQSGAACGCGGGGKAGAYHGYTGKILKEDIEALVAPPWMRMYSSWG